MDEEASMPPPDTRPSIRSARTASNILPESPRRDMQAYDNDFRSHSISRATTFEGSASQLRDMSPIGTSRMSRVPSENINMRAQRSQLRPLTRVTSGNNDVFNEPYDDPTFSHDSPDRPWEVGSQRSASPALSQGSAAPSRTASYSTLSSSLSNNKKQAPPPPPSRAKKHQPPPPPMKRSALSTNNVSYA